MQISIFTNVEFFSQATSHNSPKASKFWMPGLNTNLMQKYEMPYQLGHSTIVQIWY